MSIRLILLLLFGAISFNSSARITVVTEISSVAYYEGNEIKGIGTALVKEVMASSGLDYDIRIVPWARAYRDAITKPNTLIYPLNRTASREKHFHWVGKILPLNYNFYRLSTRPEIAGTSLNALKKFTVSANRKDVTTVFLQRHNFTKLAYVGGLVQELKMLLAHKVDLIILSEDSVAQILASHRIPQDSLVPVLDIPQLSGASYIAYSKQTPLNIVEKTKAAYHQIVKDGRYQAIMSSRLYP